MRGLLARWRAVRAASSTDRGFTLVELLVASSLTLVVSTVVAGSVVSSHQLFRATDDEATGQTDVRTTIERLGRDIRNARSLDPGATASQLVIWIDSNSDYKKQSSEVVTWTLVESTNGHFDVTRLRDGATSRTARFVISEIAFCYKVEAADACLATPLTAQQAAAVRVVESDIEYDATPDNGTGSRHTNFTERIRNVA